MGYDCFDLLGGIPGRPCPPFCTYSLVCLAVVPVAFGRLACIRVYLGLLWRQLWLPGGSP